MRTANLVLSFLLELAVLLAVAVWGFTVGPGLAGELVLGLGGPSLYAVGWGVCAAPRSVRALSGPARAAFEVAWFGSAVVALAASGHLVWAVALGLLCAVNQALALRWHQ